MIQGFDSLRREPCTIKRQKTDDPTAERELACFNMFHALPHANILKMTGMFFDRFDDVEYMYICTESCSTSLWKKLADDIPELRDELLLPHQAQH